MHTDSLIGVEQKPCRPSSLLESHIERLHHQCTIWMVGEGPSDNAAGKKIEHNSQVLRLWKDFHNRKAWLFCWTELGAEHVGIIQSLICTCKLHGIDPYTYLTDVLLRVNEHPARRVTELTPRVWKERFAAQPLRSDLYRREAGASD